MGDLKYMKRRSFLATSGLSVAAIGSGMGSPFIPAVHAEPRLRADDIKVTGIKTLLIDNIPPFVEIGM